MRIQDIFPSKYVRAADLNGKDVTLTIVKAAMQEMGHGAEKETKLVLSFAKASKSLICNRTIAMTIAKLHGMDTDDWINKRVTIYPTRIRAFGQVHEVIRVREQIPPAPPVAPAALAVQEEAATEMEDIEDIADVDEGNPLAADDQMWEPDTGPERATQDQLDELDKLGIAYYDADIWPGKLRKLVQHVTTGATTVAAQLSPAECERLITGIKNKQAAAVQSTNGKAKPVANGVAK